MAVLSDAQSRGEYVSFVKKGLASSDRDIHHKISGVFAPSAGVDEPPISHIGLKKRRSTYM